MATTQLSLYNEALLLVGERELTALSDTVEARYRLDTAYANGVNYCLELVSPSFARKTTNLTSYSTSSQHAYDNVFTLPADYIGMVEVYSDDKLDQPISRYIIDGGTLACNYTSIYLRYISNGYALTSWDKSFERVVVAYLAQSVAPRIAPDEMDRINALFDSYVEQAIALSSRKEPSRRPSNENTTLTNPLRTIYNRALQILGLEEINTNTDDSDRKVKLDVAWSSQLVASLLEETGWHWAISSMKMEYNPSLEPVWGYTKVFDKPADMHRMDGLFCDEYMRVPLKEYMDEQDYIYANVTECYIKFVSAARLTDYSNWPAHFSRLAGSALARDAAAALGVDPVYTQARFKEDMNNARNIDIMQSPPRLLSGGSWTGSRSRGNYYRGRP